MRNIFLEVEYVGTNYFGFQIQDKKDKRQITIQGVIEEALFKLFRKKVRITYAGRTDRGVHARGQVINFKIQTNILLKNIKKALNSFLPPDIRIKNIKKVPLDFHSRFWAKSKIYRYIISQRKEPTVFWRDFSWHIDKPLDLEAMQKISLKLIGRKDFSLFAKEAKKYKDCRRCIKAISIKKRGSFVHIDIEADGFLRNMARNIIFFLVKVGNDKIPLTKAYLVLKRKVSYANKPAKACGLYLYKVNYK